MVVLDNVSLAIEMSLLMNLDLLYYFEPSYRAVTECVNYHQPTKYHRPTTVMKTIWGTYTFPMKEAGKVCTLDMISSHFIPLGAIFTGLQCPYEIPLRILNLILSNDRRDYGF